MTEKDIQRWEEAIDESITAKRAIRKVLELAHNDAHMLTSEQREELHMAAQDMEDVFDYGMYVVYGLIKTGDHTYKFVNDEEIES